MANESDGSEKILGVELAARNEWNVASIVERRHSDYIYSSIITKREKRKETMNGRRKPNIRDAACENWKNAFLRCALVVGTYDNRCENVFKTGKNLIIFFFSSSIICSIPDVKFAWNYHRNQYFQTAFPAVAYRNHSMPKAHPLSTFPLNLLQCLFVICCFRPILSI